jgi:protoporphyrinogen oxidase
MDLNPLIPHEVSTPLGTLVLGGGLAGLSAGYRLSKEGRRVSVVEADPFVGGLSRTVNVGEFLFDLGGHRFVTKDKGVELVVKLLMEGELITVSRSSKIYLRNKFFDYPLTPKNALSGLGMLTVARILADYSLERLRSVAGNGRCVSLEDWVVKNFGRTMFNIYFKEYSEKVWGIDCQSISEKWVEKRIRGLSLAKALKNAFFKFSGREIPTLADTFLYPRRGIGRIAQRLREEVERENSVHTSAPAVAVGHDGRKVRSVTIRHPEGDQVVEPGNVVSTIPMPALVKMMDPAPPQEVLEAAGRLRYRDLLLVAVIVGRDRVTDQTWIYIPEKKIPFGRIHEPKNWSAEMAPTGKTLLVVEYFCFRGDDTWNASDEELSRTTAKGLETLGFIKEAEVTGTEVLRIPGAYPLFELGFEEHCERLYSWLDGFENLHIAGRSGTFQYYNMDHAILSGFETAELILNGGDRR